MKTYKLKVLFALFFTVASCGTDPGIGHLEEADTSQSPLTFVEGRNWVPSIIPVCWESQNIPSYNDREIVRTWITSNHEKDLKVHFVGWNACQDDKYSKGVRISYVDDPNIPPKVLAFGNGSPGVAGNMLLNFTFQNWSPWCRQSVSDREFCIRSTAGHEFGHILGARHEQSRSDTPQECFDWLATQGITGQEPNKPLSNVVPSGAPWDINSMMNYCNDAGYKNGFPNFATDNKLVWNNGGLFSPRDLLGFQNIYSRFKLEGYTTGLNASPGSEFGFEKGSNPFYPDLLQTTARRPSGSGFVEVHSMTYDSQYKIFNRHIATSLRIPTSQDFYGFSFTDWDKDGKADMVYMVSNGASGRLELHVMSGSSNFQSYLLQTSVAVMNSRDYKFAFGNYYGSGRPDLYIFQKWANSTYLIILSASSNYQNSWIQSGSATPARFAELAIASAGVNHASLFRARLFNEA